MPIVGVVSGFLVGVFLFAFGAKLHFRSQNNNFMLRNGIIRDQAGVHAPMLNEQTKKEIINLIREERKNLRKEIRSTVVDVLDEVVPNYQVELKKAQLETIRKTERRQDGDSLLLETELSQHLDPATRTVVHGITSRLKHRWRFF